MGEATLEWCFKWFFLVCLEEQAFWYVWFVWNWLDRDLSDCDQQAETNVLEFNVCFRTEITYISLRTTQHCVTDLPTLKFRNNPKISFQSRQGEGLSRPIVCALRVLFLFSSAIYFLDSSHILWFHHIFFEHISICKRI